MIRGKRCKRGIKTLPIVEQIINQVGRPMRVPEIYECGLSAWPMTGREPKNVLARDLALSVLDDDDSPFVRIEVGLYSTRKLVAA